MMTRTLLAGLAAGTMAVSASATTLNVGTLADTASADLASLGTWEVGETYYFQATFTGAVNAGGQVTGIGLDIGEFGTASFDSEQVFAGDGFAAVPWAVFTAGGVAQGSTDAPGFSADATVFVLAATRGATDADNTFSLYINPDLTLDEVANTADLTGNLTTADLAAVTNVRAISNTGDLTGVVVAANGDTVFGVPEPSSLALLGLGGLMIARRRRG